MKSLYKPNISTPEKCVSTVTGVVLALAGYKRSSTALGLVGLGLVARGVSGFCPVNAVIGRNHASTDTREALGGSGGILVEAQATIDRPPHEVYAYWRQLDNLPRFMSHLLEVEDLGSGRSVWTASGPLGVPVSWAAAIINDIPGQLISWRSIGQSDVISAGSVRFNAAQGGRGTDVRVKLQYEPPAGKLGAAVAWLFGEDPQRQIDEDLARFRQLLEMGEGATGERDRASWDVAASGVV